MPKEGRDLWEAVRASRPASVDDLLEQSRKRRENFHGGIQRLQHAAVQFAWVAGPMFLIFNVPRILFGKRKKRPLPEAGPAKVIPGRPGQQQMNPEEQKAYLQDLMKQREEYLKKMQEAQLKAKLEARKAFLERQAQQEKEAKEQAEKAAAAGEAEAATSDAPAAAAAAAAAAPKGLSGGLPVKGIGGGLPVKGMGGGLAVKGMGAGLPAKPGAAAAAPAAVAAAAAAAPAAAPRGLGGSGGLLPRGAPAKPTPAPAAAPAESQPAEPKGLGAGLGLAPRKTSKPSAPAGFGKPAGLKGGLPPRAGLASMAAAMAEEDDDEDEWEEDDGTFEDAEDEEEEGTTEPAAALAPAPAAPPQDKPKEVIRDFTFPGATADSVPLPDGSGWLVRRKMAADNSCLFNAVDYVKYGYKDSSGPAHAASQYGMQLRLVVANEVEDHPDKFNDAFLNMPNKQYVRWIQDPSNWGGGIELSILSEHFKMEIGAVNVRSKTCHVFGEASGYKQRVLLIYDGNHYDAIAIASTPSAAQLKDETSFDPVTNHGAAVMAAATKMAQLSWEMKSRVAGGPLMSLFGAAA